MSKGNYQIIYEMEAETLNEVVSIALNMLDQTGISPKSIKKENEVIEWDTQEMIKAIAR